MIDTRVERVYPFREAVNLRIIPRRNGRPMHVSGMHRWATVGIDGIVLESVQAGGARATSEEAIARFFERLTEAKSAGKAASIQRPVVVRDSAEREERKQAAARRQVAAGAKGQKAAAAV